MDFKKQLGKNIAAFVLFLALMLPSAIQFSHIFEGHEHEICTEQSTHVHENVVKCEICSFHLASIDYTISDYPDLSQVSFPIKTDDNFPDFQLSSFKTTNTQLRAPPAFS